MLADKNPEIEVVDDPEKDSPDTESEIVVDLEKKESEKPKLEIPKTHDDEYQKLKNRQLWLERQQEKVLKQNQQLMETIQALRQASVQPVSQEMDEIDDIAQKDWKLGVKKVVEKDIESKVQEILQKRDQTIQQYQRQINLEAELERSKQLVLSEFPSIEDDSTEEATLYRQVLNEDPSLLSNVHGPELAMRRMKERMRQMGKILPSEKSIIDKEVTRLKRAEVSSIIGRQASQNGKITLTKDQKEFCDYHKIPYEQYAKNIRLKKPSEELKYESED